ncbi:MAG: carbamoyltransferase HypF [Caldilineaceae bacterium]
METQTQLRQTAIQPSMTRLAMHISGVVQGVGFRPFVYRLATELHLVGWVLNSAQGVFVEVEGNADALDLFRRRIEDDTPPQAQIQQVTTTPLPPAGYCNFEIRHSDTSGPRTTQILPDVATCPDCLRELLDPNDRRYRYPFINCTNCGPRYSIIEGIPYDRPQTTMREFVMCAECQAEYDDPGNRRFHAQPNACPHCGPHVAFWDSRGLLLVEEDDAILAAADAIRQGWVVAVKGLGGFHLMVDARSEDAVAKLRRRKRREAKPFAVMVPSVAQAECICAIAGAEEELLTSSAAPIVLLSKRLRSEIAPNVAPDNPRLGVMLPYTPLHHLLMAELNFPVVATSGNLSDEPICTDEHEALERLRGIADFFLVHNRPIARPVDDSVARVVAGEVQILRRSRGYAPLPIRLPEPVTAPVLAVGAHLKNSVALAVGDQLFLSQHIGDLETPEAYDAFRHTIDSLCTLYDVEPAAVVCDAHPDYMSTHFAAELAEQRGIPLRRVQHHHAHVLACMAENNVRGPVLGLAWDGTGYGDDGTIWGGEFLLVDANGYRRVAHLRPFALAGGDAAVREPRRSALGLRYAVKRIGDAHFWQPLPDFTPEERTILSAMLNKGLNTVNTTSMGRLFDGVAALLGLHPFAAFEGQAAMSMEFAALQARFTTEHYLLPVLAAEDDSEHLILDWATMIDQILADVQQGRSVGRMALKFHNTLIEAAVETARRIRDRFGVERRRPQQWLFQDKLLTESDPAACAGPVIESTGTSVRPTTTALL